MVTVIGAKRRSAVLTSSGLACLSAIPTINLTAGCLHNCAYCYIRGYRNFPGEGRIVLYENTLELLRGELSQTDIKHRTVYFSPSSDLFQPASEVLELSYSILEFLFRQGIGVAFLTKGCIPDVTLRLLIDNAELVRAQIGLLTLDERICQVFEPHAASPERRLRQLQTLIAGGIQAEARLDPILPALTDDPGSLDNLFAALAGAGVRRAAAGALFLRPGVLYWLKRNVPGAMLAPLLAAYRGGQTAVMRGAQYPIWNLPTEVRRDIFDRVRRSAAERGIELNVCACKNQDIARGSCNIAGAWPRRTATALQPALLGA